MLELRYKMALTFKAQQERIEKLEERIRRLENLYSPKIEDVTPSVAVGTPP